LGAGRAGPPPERDAERLLGPGRVGPRRCVLQQYAVRRAAERHPEGGLDLAALMVMCDRMEQSSTRPGSRAADQLTALNLQFHVALHEGAGNVAAGDGDRAKSVTRSHVRNARDPLLRVRAVARLA
jgi:DNA-binding GntR family transcriptional regulator